MLIKELKLNWTFKDLEETANIIKPVLFNANKSFNNFAHCGSIFAAC
jgi:hypothetical protein